jgi:hypothetical protein
VCIAAEQPCGICAYLQEALALFGGHSAVAHELGPPTAEERRAYFGAICAALALPPRPPAPLVQPAAVPQVCLLRPCTLKL